MAQFTVNNTRVDPYKNFRFRVWWDKKIVAGVSKVSPLKRTTEVVSHREGGDLSTPRHSPGRTSFEAITMERGVTFDEEFQAWANLVYTTQGPAGVSLANYKKEIRIEVLNLQQVVVRAYNVAACWVSEFTAQADLDANANAVLIESIVIQNEGWERDPDVKEVQET